jgi:hypothetical protein
MNGVIATMTITQDSILHGGHHIIESVKMQDNITGLKAGDLLVYTATGYKKGVAEDAAYDAVLLEDHIEKTTEDVLNVCVHGSVRAEKLLLAGAPAPEAVRQKLRARGIYAFGKIGN